MADEPKTISGLDDDTDNNGIPLESTYFPAATPIGGGLYSTYHYTTTGLRKATKPIKVKHTSTGTNTITKSELIGKEILFAFLDGYYSDTDDLITTFNSSTGKVDFAGVIPTDTKIVFVCV